MPVEPCSQDLHNTASLIARCTTTTNTKFCLKDQVQMPRCLTKLNKLLRTAVKVSSGEGGRKETKNPINSDYTEVEKMPGTAE
eukprot:457117-Pleurochrysis_carterae.AAC.1